MTETGAAHYRKHSQTHPWRWRILCDEEGILEVVDVDKEHREELFEVHLDCDCGHALGFGSRIRMF